MYDFKRLKDPIYGYIDIPTELMNHVIDTAVFQRLRRIIQTSYAPLYASAVHNRFVHSLGVYHLGEIAINQIQAELGHVFDSNMRLSKIPRVFLLACLLHDVGHVPFSHTGEKFYLDDKLGYQNLHGELIHCVNSPNFQNDVPSDKSESAAPHEIMSSIIGINEFGEYLPDEFSREFFARCITGYRYSEESKENGLLNCLISLLNSKVIDVDKLDYLIRDAYITGFNTVNIDYIRLLKSLTIVTEFGKYKLAYKKNAISVIENVVYAHDAEKKWIQSHPVVLYESFILQRIFAYLSQKINDNGVRLFSKEALSVQGIDIGEGKKIRLLCDDDIVYLMKNDCWSELSEEYFERSSRRHPIWKSEAEYNALFLDISEGGRALTELENAMEAVANYLATSNNAWVIDDSLVSKLEKELSELDGLELDEPTKKVQKKDKNAILKIMKCLQTYAKENDMDNNFVILMASQFNSGFGKIDFSETRILFNFDEEVKTAKVGKIVSSLSAKEKKRDNFFYLYYKRKISESVELDKRELCRRLYKEFI